MAREIVKRVENAILYSDGSIRVDNVRLSYPHIDKPWVKKGDTNKDGTPKAPRYSATGIAPKATHKAMKDLIKDVMDNMMAEKKVKLGADKKFLRNGDDSGKAEYEGAFTISAAERQDKPPSIRGKDGKTFRGNVSQTFYAGCVVNMLIRPWWQDNDSGKRINANLLAVQFVGDGPRIGEGGITEDDIDDTFDPVGDASGFESDTDMDDI